MAVELKKQENQFVVFLLGNETYGVDINNVREIITMQSITEVPGTMGNIEGIINLRGHVIPVFNIKKRFNIQEQDNISSTRIVVIEVKGNTLGIIVDGVSEVLRIAAEIIEKPSSMISKNVTNDYIRGIAKLEEKLVIILELERVVGQETNLEMIG